MQLCKVGRVPKSAIGTLFRMYYSTILTCSRFDAEGLPKLIIASHWLPTSQGIRSECHEQTPMYEMPLIYVFGVLGLGWAFFVLGFWAMVFCPEFTSQIFSITRSIGTLSCHKSCDCGYADVNGRDSNYRSGNGYKQYAYHLSTIQRMHADLHSSDLSYLCTPLNSVSDHLLNVWS